MYLTVSNVPSNALPEFAHVHLRTSVFELTHAAAEVHYSVSEDPTVG